MSTTQTIATSNASVRPTHSLAELLCRAIGMRVSDLHLSETRINDICTDSRRVRPGALFIALAGAKADGAKYIHDALQRGARAVLADREIELPSGVPFVRIANARDAVSRIAAHFFGLDEIQTRGEFSTTGITGTNGKSTVAFMVRAILRAAGHPTALFGTIEYDLVGRRVDAALTTPDPIDLIQHMVEAHQAGARHAVMEVSSHSLDQGRTSGIRFGVAAFTNLTQDHLDYHLSMEAYGRAKRRLFDALAADATAVVNMDDPAGESMLAACRAGKLRYAVNEPADLSAGKVELARDGSRFQIALHGKSANASLHLAGRHNVYNALAAIGISTALGVELDAAIAGLETLDQVPGRLQRVFADDLGIDVFVDYAHTDDALRNVLNALRPLTRGRLLCVFGCGGDRDRTKRPRMAQAVAEGADAFIITSDNPRTEDPLAIIADIESGLTPEARIRGVTEPDRSAAIETAVARLRRGDTLLIAGKGHENYQIIGEQKIHFDDVEVAREAIQRRRMKNP